MRSLEDRRIPSPDGRLEALLQAERRNAWEVTRARLVVAGLSFSNREFEWQGVWSACSRYFAVMEWLHGGVLRIPEARLVLIDLQDARECTVDRVESGFVQPLRLYDGKVRYVRIDLAKKAKEILEWTIIRSALWTGMRERETDVLCSRR